LLHTSALLLIRNFHAAADTDAAMFDSKIWFLSLLFFRLAFLSTAVEPPSHVPAPSPHFHTASQQFTRLSTVPLPMITTRGRFHASSLSRFSNPLIMALVLLSGDIELNPGPSAPFMVCTLSIRSILDSAHSIALSDIADSHHPDLFCLTETWIKPATTPAELVDCTMPGYTLISHPRTPRFQKSQNVGGGTAFLDREPFSQIPSTSLLTRRLKLQP